MILNIILKRKASIKEKITLVYLVGNSQNLIKKLTHIDSENFIKQYLHQHFKLI